MEAPANDTQVRAVALVTGHYLMHETAVLFWDGHENFAKRIAKALESKAAFESTYRQAFRLEFPPSGYGEPSFSISLSRLSAFRLYSCDMNEIFLRRRNKLLLHPSSGCASTQQIATLQKELAQLGYVLSEELQNVVATLTNDGLSQFLKQTTKILHKLSGAHREHSPLYPAFPDQVLKLSDTALYLNAIRHYWTWQRQPDSDPKVRPPLIDNRNPKAIQLGTQQEFEAIAKQLASSATSLSQTDKDDLVWFIRQYRTDVFRLLPKKIPFKENLAVIGAALLNNVQDQLTETFLLEHFKTATDVLRLAVALSDGDVSLAQSCKFKSVKRSLRRQLLAILESSNDLADNMLKWPERWKRLGEFLHPGEYQKRFPVTYAAFQILRNDEPYRTFNSAVQQSIKERSVTQALDLLQTRPGELARRVDWLLRISPDTKPVLDAFAAITDKVAATLLLSLIAHFKTRMGDGGIRVFLPKGNVAKVFGMNEQRESVSAEVATQVIAACEQSLVKHFAKLSPLGRCYVDPDLIHFNVPLGQRSTSRSLRTIARGSSLPMPNGGYIRLFLWWMNGRGRADVDLSAVLYADGYKFISTLAYHNLKTYGAYHSGDIVDAPKGAAEFIDLDLVKLQDSGVRYVLMALNSFTRQPYCDLPECFAGWMARECLNSGEIFEPRTVVDRIDLAANTCIAVPLLLDLQEKRVIWADIALSHHPKWANNVNNNLGGFSLMLRSLVELSRPDLHTLFSLHVKARGQAVATQEEANMVFGADGNVTALNLDEIRANYL